MLPGLPPGLLAALVLQAPEADPAALRRTMVRTQLEARGIRDARVLEAFRALPRHPFVPGPFRAQAQADQPLPIGEGQTLSQPYVVAVMLQALQLRGMERVLEVGSGSGYVLGLLDRMGCRARGVELEPVLCDRSRKTLEEVGVLDARVRCGDGFAGWAEEAPFDAILLSCAVPEVPAPLVQQLREGGRLVAPVGGREQDLVLYTRTGDRLVRRVMIPVRFVPMRRSPGSPG